MKLRAALLAALALPGCATPDANVAGPRGPFDRRPALVFVPGFYGSTLRKVGGGRRLFYTVRESLFGNNALSLYQEELGTPEGPALEVDDIFQGVTVVPWIYDVPVYAPFLRRLHDAHPEFQIVTMPYDWRDDLSLAVSKLDELTKRLKEAGAPSVSIFAHSMGGLVTSYYLAYGTQKPEAASLDWSGAKNIARVAFFGTPFRGSMIAFRSFQKGSGLPFSQRLLSADAMSSFPSMFLMTPPDALVLDGEGKKTHTNLFDVELWRRAHVGLLARKDRAEYATKRDRFTSQWLEIARRWHTLLEAPSNPPAGLRVLNVIGTGTKTFDGAYLKDNQLYFEDSEKAGLPTEPLFRDGDGTVTAERAAVPPFLAKIAHVVLIKDAPHDKLFMDPEAEKEYKGFLEVVP